MLNPYLTRLADICVAGLAALVLLVSSAHAEEAILNYDSKLAIADDGQLTVVETIHVRAENQQIKRGIYRDFPLAVEDSDGRIGTVGFDVISVKRDTRSEPYRVERSARVARVYAGKADHFLDPGEYTYEIVYTTDRQIRFFDSYDELLWNVTGNAWDFPILKAQAEVLLPPGARAQDTLFFTGPFGAKDKNATVSISSDGNVVRFETTAPLARREGLTVGVKLAKGVIPSPGTGQSTAWFWRDHKRDILGIGGFLLIAFYYVWAWLRVGRDPPAGVIVPRWDPQDGISPALTNYIDRKGLSTKRWDAMSAALLNLAVKGLVTLEDLAGDLTIVLTGRVPDTRLPVGEASLYNTLKGGSGRLTIDKANGKTVLRAATKFRTALQNEHRSNFYRLNLLHVVAGVALSATAVFLIITLGGGVEDIAAPLVAFIAGGVLITFFAVDLGQKFGSGGGLWAKVVSVGKFFVVGFMVWSLVPVAFAPVINLGGGAAITVALLDIVMLNVLFYFLLGAPTPLGRRMMDGIEGMRTYINLAEKDRMNLQGAPQMSPRHFETLLPYAVALGLEKPWSKAFEAWLATAAGAAAATVYTAAWYHGSNFSSSRISETIGGLPQALSESFTASMPAPKSSSSGFSGGGSSGGGGGGGGGGGW